MELDATTTAIVLDSTADFPEARARFANWRVVPLYVNFGAHSYRDHLDIGPEEFYVRLASSSKPPTTSQPTPGDFLAVYEELAGQYERVFSLQVSSTLSGTFASAQAAASSLPDVVRVVDTATVSAAVTMLAFALQRRLDRGTSDEEIDALVAHYRTDHRLLFTVETLEYLARGGRIGRAAALAGTLLNVKPILSLEHGQVVPLKRVRGAHQALEEFGALLAAGSADTETLRVGIAHASAPERAEELERIVARVRPRSRLEVVTALGAVVGTHAGPGTLGMFWFDDAS